ncbi:hypothetical protein A9179_01595 [Pseudomonas alcaligenes]|uniref:Uncharacterized protein n=1 Tax=Aquipseudomonas alcaligenes TaxID=43263 RepID=A0ABR7RW34_AQUAC|nr:hypothetical protein [Pseudomonas alcaligenes]MBC9248959.1 hypothetical protein [Pseudomonas alcaligenes]
MSPEQERKLLQQLLKELDAPMRTMTWWREVPLWLSVAVITLSFFYLFGTPSWPHVALIVIFFVFGMLFAHAFIKKQSHRNWPLFRNFVDKAKVETRLRELDA